MPHLMGKFGLAHPHLGRGSGQNLKKVIRFFLASDSRFCIFTASLRCTNRMTADFYKISAIPRPQHVIWDSDSTYV